MKKLFIVIFFVLVTIGTVYFWNQNRFSRKIAAQTSVIPYNIWAKELLGLEDLSFLYDYPAYTNSNPGNLIFTVSDLSIYNYFSQYLNSFSFEVNLCVKNTDGHSTDNCVGLINQFFQAKDFRVSIFYLAKKIKNELKVLDAKDRLFFKIKFWNNSFFKFQCAKDLIIPFNPELINEEKTMFEVVPIDKNRAHKLYAKLSISFETAITYSSFSSLKEGDDHFLAFKKQMSIWDKITLKAQDNLEILKHSINDMVDNHDESRLCTHCHEMSRIVLEYKKSKHYYAGVACSACHVGKGINYILDKGSALISELPAHFINRYETANDFANERYRMAMHVQHKMASRESSSCKVCHQFSASVLSTQIAAARKRHAEELKKDKSLNCIICHNYGFVHKLPKRPDILKNEK